jgi:glucosamine--fructose-6-phosphate aminotransferase (isomerizing)
MSSRIIEGNYLNDLLAQPDVLLGVTDKLKSTRIDTKLGGNLRDGTFRRVVLTGMGSSLHALYPLHLALSGAGITSHWIETAELLLGFEPLYRPETLLIGVSQSGESAEMVILAKRAGEFGHFIGITNNAESTLGRSAGTTLLLDAGAESTVSCKTYLSTLAVLHWLGACLLGGDSDATLAEVSETEVVVREYLSNWRDHVSELLPLVGGVTSVFVTGRGNSLATAGTGGLILKEATRQHAEGMSAAAFRHGPLEMAGSCVLVLIVDGDESTFPLHRRLADDVVKGGGRAVLIGPNTPPSGAFLLPALADAVMPILEILPVQMLSLALAARDGFEAGRFERASKITNIS